MFFGMFEGLGRFGCLKVWEALGCIWYCCGFAPFNFFDVFGCIWECL